MTEIVLEQRIEAPRSRVYRFLTQSAGWAIGPAESAEVDARPGGVFSLESPEGANARGEFTALVPDERLEFTWGWVDNPDIPPGSTIVSIDLADDGDGTLLTLTHRNLPADEAPLHREGWARWMSDFGPLAAGQAP